jgi:hypothetical protein
MPGIETTDPDALLSYANTAYGLYQTLRTITAKEPHAPASPATPALARDVFYEALDHPDTADAGGADRPAPVVDPGGLEQLARRVDALRRGWEKFSGEHYEYRREIDRRLADLETTARAQAAPEGEPNPAIHCWGDDPRPGMGYLEKCTRCGAVRERVPNYCREPGWDVQG